MCKYDFLVLFPINPLTLARLVLAKPSRPAEPEDNPTDAALQLELLLTHRDKLQPLQPESPTMRALTQLIEHRRRVVGDKVRITNRLTSTLKNYFPHVLHWFQEKEHHNILRLPESLADPQGGATRPRRATLETFFREHHVRYARCHRTAYPSHQGGYPPHH